MAAATAPNVAILPRLSPGDAMRITRRTSPRKESGAQVHTIPNAAYAFNRNHTKMLSMHRNKTAGRYQRVAPIASQETTGLNRRTRIHHINGDRLRRARLGLRVARAVLKDTPLPKGGRPTSTHRLQRTLYSHIPS